MRNANSLPPELLTAGNAAARVLEDSSREEQDFSLLILSAENAARAFGSLAIVLRRMDAEEDIPELLKPKNESREFKQK